MLHLGDQVDEDLKGARNAGLHSLLLDRNAQCGIEVIDRLTELSPRITEAWI